MFHHYVQNSVGETHPTIFPFYIPIVSPFTVGYIMVYAINYKYCLNPLNQPFYWSNQHFLFFFSAIPDVAGEWVGAEAVAWEPGWQGEPSGAGSHSGGCQASWLPLPKWSWLGWCQGLPLSRKPWMAIQTIHIPEMSRNKLRFGSELQIEFPNRLRYILSCSVWTEEIRIKDMVF